MAAKEIKFPEIDSLYPPVAESSRILVGCRREDYSASLVARAVEDCDAHVLNLNVTAMGGDDDAFPLMFDLRVNHRSADAVVRSLERYGFTPVLVADASDADDNTLRRRFDELMRYIEL